MVGKGVGNGLVEGTSHGDMVGQIGGEASIEVRRASLQVGGKPTILHGKIVVFFLVHLFIDHILLRDSQGASGTTFVDLRGSTSRLDSCFETAITSP